MSQSLEWIWAVLGVQLLVALYMFLSLRSAERERAELSKEMFGLMKKIEGLTAKRREQMLLQFDKVLEVLSVRLPTAIAAKVSDLVFEIERQVLSRLAEIEPNLKEDADRRKMEELICSMEKLEETVVAITSDSVQQVMLESRRSLFEEDSTSCNPSRLFTQ